MQMKGISKEAARQLAMLVGKKAGIQVIYGAPYACTDFEKIYLPNGDDFDEEYRTLLMGYIIHEPGHIMHSSKTHWERINRDHGSLGGTIYNIFDDVFMERRQIRIFPGAHKFLHETVKVLIKMGKLGGIPNDEAKMADLINWMLNTSRYKVVKQDALKTSSEEYEVFCREHFGDALVDNITNIISLLDADTTTTDDVFRCTVKVCELLAEAKKEAEQNQGSDKEDSESNGDQKDQNEEADNTQDSKPDESKQEEPSPNGGEDSSGDSKGKPNSDAAKDGSNDSDMAEDDASATPSSSQNQNLSDLDLNEDPNVVTDISDILSEALDEEAKRHPSGEPEVLTASASTETVASFNLRKALSLLTKYQGVFTHKVTAALEALSDQRAFLNEDKGRLSLRHIDNLINRSGGFLLKNEVNKVANTACAFVLDHSSSMTPHAAEAMALTLSFMKAVEAIDGNQTALFTYGGNIHIAKGFEERMSDACCERATKAPFGGGTPSGTATRLAINELSFATCERKVVFLITDGQTHETQLLEEQVKRARCSGIEVVGIGFGPQGKQAVEAIQGLSAVSAENITQLSDQLTELLIAA